MENKRSVIVGFICFVIFVGAVMFFRSSKSTQGEGLTSVQKAEIADVRRQLQGAKRGDIVLYKDRSLCCITSVNAEEFHCLLFLGSIEHACGIQGNDYALSKIMRVVRLEDPSDLNHENYKDFALRYLKQPLPH